MTTDTALVPFGCGFFHCLGSEGATWGFAHCGAVTRDVVVGAHLSQGRGSGSARLMVRQLGPRVVAFGCGAFHALYDLHLFPCAVPSVYNYNFWSECVLGWVGSGIATSSLCSLSLSSALSLVRNRHCETSSIGWGAQCRRVGEGAAISVVVSFFLHVTVACASRSLCSVAGVRVLCSALSRDEGPHVDACSDVRAVPFFPLRIFVMFGEKREQPVHHTPSEIGTGS